jgi:hypothetical protein
MKIQFNTDKNIDGTEDFTSPFIVLIEEELKQYKDQITRIEVHLSDEDGDKEGLNAKRCLLEARISGMKPIAVSSQSDTEEQALTESLNKLNTSLKTIFGRLNNR